jgi:succinate dehydrogenase / fumarate reductase iron-sulfur subunit
MTSGNKLLKLKLHVWRQKNGQAKGQLVDYNVDGISTDMSFLEMLDVLNEQLIHEGQDPVAFDYDCREGICGSCGIVIDGIAHGPARAATTCQQYVRDFSDGATVIIEPWRAGAFPLVKDLVVDRSAFDRIIASGGFVSVDTGSAPEANSLPIGKDVADSAMDSAACIGCGACVAACKNASAALFVGAKVAHLALLPQGHPERGKRVVAMVEQMEKEGFGACSNEGECQAVCPKEISVANIQTLTREYARAVLRGG